MRARLIALGIVLAVFALFAPASIGQKLRGSGQQAVSPLTRRINRVSSSATSFFGALLSIREVITELDALKQENQRLAAELAELKEVRLENETLRQELQAGSRAQFKETLAAQVIGRSSVRSIPELTIDRGARDGIKENQPVLAAANLVGTVAAVNDATATVRLITSHNSIVPVILQSSRAVGLLRGGLRGLVVDDLPSGSEIEQGEPVVTQSLGPFQISGILVGTVERIVSSPSDVFRVVSVVSAVDFSTLSFVTVVVE